MEVKIMDLKNKLLSRGYKESSVNKFLAHLDDKASAKYPITVKPEAAYGMYVKVANLGLEFDGINVVLTGQNMFMVTYHGYKNKVKQVYPSAKFDVQLVREGDVFDMSKNSGKVTYNHVMTNPFEDKNIRGAYVVIDIDGFQYPETLSKEDYNKMKDGSKQSQLWDKWESEFWLKSVMKRACKRHFYDVIAEIDEVDNSDYGLADEVNEAEKKVDSIVDAFKEG
jgi:recombinational DNA repair protein RecT